MTVAKTDVHCSQNLVSQIENFNKRKKKNSREKHYLVSLDFSHLKERCFNANN